MKSCKEKDEEISQLRQHNTYIRKTGHSDSISAFLSHKKTAQDDTHSFMDGKNKLKWYVSKLLRSLTRRK
jgi:hypothetical protein